MFYLHDISVLHGLYTSDSSNSFTTKTAVVSNNLPREASYHTHYVRRITVDVQCPHHNHHNVHGVCTALRAYVSRHDAAPAYVDVTSECSSRCKHEVQCLDIGTSLARDLQYFSVTPGFMFFYNMTAQRYILHTFFTRDMYSLHVHAVTW